jgi:hypothetical protein
MEQRCPWESLFFAFKPDPEERNMKERLLITTAIGLMLGTAAFAQSPSEQRKNNPPPAAQSPSSSQTNSNSPASSASSPAQSAPSSSATSSPNSAPSAQNTAPAASQQPSNTTSQSAPNTTGPAQAQSNNPPAQPAAQPNSPSQAQTNTSPPANNQTQSQTQPAPGTNTNAGTQPSNNAANQQPNNQTNTAQSPSSTNVNISANLNDTQRTRVTESITRLNAAPLTNVNFALSVGTVVPRDIRLQPLPTDVVEIVPQYRGYNFVVVRDEIVIVEPSSYKIVDVLPRSGRSTAGAPASQPTAAAPASRKTTFSDSDREVIRKHSRSRAEQPRTEQRTTGSSSTSTRVRVGDRLPDSVEIRSFPDEVYRDSPTLREYRYIERDNRTYVIEPRERTIIEEID